ncbi:MAG: hypothetical protein KBC96_06370 [Armatimonadetes bacterium]|nr:hypothetical protein [Armatimonadota bacterium]
MCVQDVLDSDAGYEVFQSVLRALTLPDDLEIEYFIDWNPPGRHFYACAMSKAAWHFPSNGGDLPTFIHIEPQFQRAVPGRTATFRVYLHWEIDPYETQAQAGGHYSPGLIERYQQRRRNLQAHMRRYYADLLALGGAWNGVGSKKIEIGRMTVERLREELQPVVAEISAAVDDYLENHG